MVQEGKMRMSLIVQKFGGSSVADVERVYNVADIVTKTYAAGNDVVVVLSAQGKTTDQLLAKAAEVNPNASKREQDMLLACGEQMSVALMAMAIEKLGYPVISLNAWQMGMQTDTTYGAARIERVEAQRVLEELEKRRIVLITGFQGVNRYEDITTLGRGGSDTTAVALAVALKADLCQIYTDVDGVFTADPRIVPDAKMLKEITYDEMLELASLGAKVLHNRCVEMAKRYHIEMEVLSSFSRKPGTIVREVTKVEKLIVSGVTKDINIARIALVGLENVPGVAYRVFSLLGKEKINIDIILQSIGRNDTKDITFTVPIGSVQQVLTLLEDKKDEIRYDHIDVNREVAKVSIVGAGIADNAGVAAKMFEALYERQININMISSSEIRLSVLIDEKDADLAVQVIHDKFFRS